MRLRFFGGKGGAGKTTLAAASALAEAEAGRRVLVVSTDPAHSLGDALGFSLRGRTRRVPTRRGVLHAVELDADRALGRWMARRRAAFRAIALHGTLLERREVDRLLRLALPGVDELIGLIEVMRLAGTRRHDTVVVDTAPTGHALRLLATPALLARIAEVLDGLYAKHRFLARHLRGEYRPDAADALIAELDDEARALTARLRDPTQTELVWVTLPEVLSLRETAAAVGQLAALGIDVTRVLVNQLTGNKEARRCPACAARRRSERAALAAISSKLAQRPLGVVLAQAREPRNLPSLRALARELAAAGRPTARQSRDWLNTLAPPGTRLLLFVGKGGVGKTTCAATAALALAARGGGAVLLVSTDPAHSLGDVLGHEVGDRPRAIPGAPSGLRVQEIDAQAGFHSWRAKHRDELEAALGGPGRAGMRVAFDGDVVRDLLDLTPPGLDELWSVRTLIAAISPPPAGGPRYRLVVVDTAPTGHALRMLAMPDIALAWVRELLALLLRYRQILRPGQLARDLVEISRDLRRFRALLRDGRATRAVLVSRAGHLPMRETERLGRSLRALRIGVSTLILNAMSAAEDRACPRCAEGARGVRPALRSTLDRLVAPAVAPPPRGVRALEAWGRRWTRLAG